MWDRCTSNIVPLLVHLMHLQLWVQSRLCVLPSLSVSSRAGRTTWKAGQWVVILIRPSILIQCVCGSEKSVNSQAFFSWSPPDSTFLLHSISPLTAPEIRYWRFTNDGPSKSQHYGFMILLFFILWYQMGEISRWKIFLWGIQPLSYEWLRWSKLGVSALVLCVENKLTFAI